MASESNTQRAFRKGVYLSIALAAVATLAIARTRAGQWLEDGSYDARVRLATDPSKADPRIVIVDVDNASLTSLQEKLGKWPWTRRVWSVVIDHVTKGQPRAIAVDALFGGEENAAVDSAFADSLRRSGKSVLAFSFVSADVDHDGEGPEQAHLRQLESQASTGGIGRVFPEKDWTPNVPLPLLANAAAGLGSINSSPDPGGVIRREAVQVQFRGKSYLTLGARAVQIADPANAFQWHAKNGPFDSNFVLRGGKRIPVDEEGHLLLLYHGDSLHSYVRLPIWEVICSIYEDQCPNAVHKFPSSYFHDKIVLIGASASGSYEARPTPLDAQAPGFIAHAAAIDNLLNGEAMRETPFLFVALVVAVLSILGGLLQLKLRSIAKGAPLVVFVVAIYLSASYVSFRNAHFVLPIVAPCLAIILSYSGSSAARYVTTGRELRRTRGVLDRYVAPQIVDYVMSNLENFRLNGDKRELTILISDVRNFTTMTERSEPVELITLLNDYLAAMVEIIFKYNGIVDKFIGDGILAYWGAFTPNVNHAEEASLAALEMIEKVKELNQRWVSEGKSPITIGIGVNTGCAIFGNIGRGKKIEFTVIGDAVNLAARLEGLNKEFGTSIVISDATRERIGGKARVRALGGVKVKGKTVETKVFELQAYESGNSG